jgi:hypothetical protein
VDFLEKDFQVLRDRGYEVVILTRSKRNVANEVYWDGKSVGD